MSAGNDRDARPDAMRLPIGTFPTPIEPAAALSTPGFELWVKRDDKTNAVYGGNKVRKLERVLADAKARGATRIVTVGAAGSHHVLATTIFGTRVGLAVEAVLVPQPGSAHVRDVLRASLARGVRAFPVTSRAMIPWAVAARVATGAMFVPVGGSSVPGAMGYFDAAREVATQVRAGQAPEPDVCVVALGSGGTAAGLAAGFEAEGMKTRVVGVCVSQPPALVILAARRLTRACARRAGVHAEGDALRTRLAVDVRFLGDGYGLATAEGDAATRDAARAGLTLDATYTAKAFAAALWHVRAQRSRRVLYLHTLSSAPMAPLLEGARAFESLDPAVRALAADATDAANQ
jgi:1-aminocyclopropane-1-carboxylate deaminase/D-cysteine desulfhydrase-like pyridoxal-dependent ACC family enzyme